MGMICFLLGNFVFYITKFTLFVLGQKLYSSSVEINTIQVISMQSPNPKINQKESFPFTKKKTASLLLIISLLCSAFFAAGISYAQSGIGNQKYPTAYNSGGPSGAYDYLVFTFENASGTFYAAKDSFGRIIDSWTSTDCAVVTNHISEALHNIKGGGLVLFGVGTFYFNSPWYLEDFLFVPDGVAATSGEGCGIQIMGQGMSSTYLIANATMRSVISILDSDFFYITKLSIIGANKADYNVEINTNHKIWCGHITIEKTTFLSSKIAGIYGNASDIRVFDASFGDAQQWHIIALAPSLRVDKGNTFGRCGLSGTGGGIYITAESIGQAQILNSYFEDFKNFPAIQIGDADATSNFANGNIISGNIFSGTKDYTSSKGINGVNTANNQIENNYFNNVAISISLSNLWNNNGYNTITGNTFHLNEYPITAGNLVGILLKEYSTAASRNIISNNMFTGNGNSTNIAIHMAASGYNSITSNHITRFGTAIQVTYTSGAGYNTITSNVISDGEYGIKETSQTDNNIISLNVFRYITTPITLSSANTGSAVIDNFGYNPKGVISTPFLGNSGIISDFGNNATMTSGWVYTNVGSPKSIYLTGGNVTAIAINGVDTGLTTGTFTLNPRETFNVTFSSAPTLIVNCK